MLIHGFSDIAYRTCRLLGYHSLKAGEDGAYELDIEHKRRCFWASWIVFCLSQTNATFKAESWKEAVGLPLPCDEESFAVGKPVLKEAFDANGQLEAIQQEENSIRTSYMGEMVKLMGLW